MAGTSGFETLRGRNHWSHCAYPASFFNVNGVVCLPWFSLLLFPSIKGILIAISMSAFFLYFEAYKRMTPAAIFRRALLFISGKKRPALNYQSALARFFG